MRAKSREISVILARQGSGKTALMQYLLLANPKSCIVFDPTYSLPPFKNRVFVDFETQSVRRVLNEIGRRIYTQKIDVVINRCEDPESVLGLIYHNLENVAVVIDEVDLAYSSFISNKSNLYKIANFGRHSELDLIAVARRPANMPRAITSQANFIYLGNTNAEPLDSKYIRSYVSREAFAAYESVGAFEFLRYDNAKHTFRKMRLPKKALALMGVA